MAIVKIVTDSTADIPKEIAEKWDIRVVPLKVHMDGETYLDGVTIKPSEFFEKLQNSNQFPSTSQPSPAEFEQTYREIIDRCGDDAQILSIHLSSALSGTYQSACLARGMIGSTADIEVIDSKKASYILGMIVVEAAKLAYNGGSKRQCMALIDKMIREMKQFFVLDSLAYLQKGGRIGKAQAIVGTLLNVKPILSLNEAGEVYPFEKTRGKKKAIATMLEQCKNYAQNDEVIVSALYGVNRSEAERLKERLTRDFNVKEITISEIGPVIGAHVGPQSLALAMYKP